MCFGYFGYRDKLKLLGGRERANKSKSSALKHKRWVLAAGL
jgi:hypothetical protein